MNIPIHVIPLLLLYQFTVRYSTRFAGDCELHSFDSIKPKL